MPDDFKWTRKRERAGKPKILGWYIIRDGEQIAWHRSKSEAMKTAKKLGGTIAAEYALALSTQPSR